jgi:hypothetical protein
VADAGPLGYLSLAAHGHADALAFTMSVAGREFLIDPGAYAYQSKEEWRNYFRGSAAHNTIRVDRVDQSVIGGAFIWLRKAAATVERWETSTERDRLVASHDGYTRLPDPVTHRREIVFLRTERHVRVEDSLTCAGAHDVEMFWHFSELCEVELSGRSILARNGDATVVLSPPAEFGEIVLLEGADSPIAGWVSREFDVKRPTKTALCRGRIAGPVHLRTEIDVPR